MSRSPSDRKPLMAELILETLKREEAFRRAHKNNGWYWGSSKCSILLGLGHLCFGTTLLIYDLATNATTEATFAISSSLCFIICAIFLFISARRLDRPAHFLIIIFCAIAAGIGIFLIGNTAYHISRICIVVQTANCTLYTVLIHVFLLLVVMVELTLCLFSIYASYHYLRCLSERCADLMYESLISGDFNRLPPKRRHDEQISVITTEEGSSPTRSVPASLRTA